MTKGTLTYDSNCMTWENLHKVDVHVPNFPKYSQGHQFNFFLFGKCNESEISGKSFNSKPQIIQSPF